MFAVHLLDPVSGSNLEVWGWNKRHEYVEALHTHWNTCYSCFCTTRPPARPCTRFKFASAYMRMKQETWIWIVEPYTSVLHTCCSWFFLWHNLLLSNWICLSFDCCHCIVLLVSWCSNCHIICIFCFCELIVVSVNITCVSVCYLFVDIWFHMDLLDKMDQEI